MELKYFKMCFSNNGKETKLINPTIIYCSKELAEAYGKAITKCNSLEGGKGNIFTFKEISKEAALNFSKDILNMSQVREEIYHELDRGYAYASKSDAEYDINCRKAQEEASNLIGDKLNREIDNWEQLKGPVR